MYLSAKPEARFVISLRLTGELRLALQRRSLSYFLSLWERKEVRVLTMAQ
jgi:hypothetical protein